MREQEILSIISESYDRISELGDYAYKQYKSGRQINTYVDIGRNIYRIIRSLERRSNLSRKQIKADISLLMGLGKVYRIPVVPVFSPLVGTQIKIYQAGTFVGLLDTPSTFAGEENKYLQVNTSGDGIVFSSGSGGGATTFLGLTDTPSTYSGSANYLLRVNATPNSIEFIDGSTLYASSTHNHDLDYAPLSHNHDSDYISIISTPNTGNFPTITAGGELITSAYGPSSFALSSHTHPWGDITSTPTTLSGYGISDTKANFNTALSDGSFLFSGDSIPWSSITSTPTTLSGYGISDTMANFDIALSDGNFAYRGTAADNRVAVWTSGSQIFGDESFTWSGSGGLGGTLYIGYTGTSSSLTWNTANRALIITGASNDVSFQMNNAGATGGLGNAYSRHTLSNATPTGDAFTTFERNQPAAIYWSVGMDHSDSTSFKITSDSTFVSPSTGTTMMRIATNGLFTFNSNVGGGGTTNFLRADGTWAAPPGGSGDSFVTWHYAADSGYTWGTSDIVASGTDTMDLIPGSGIAIDTDATLKAIRIRTTGAGGLTSAYVSVTDGTTTSNASGGDTFKLRSANNRLSIAVQDNDATHGDNALFTVNEANLSIGWSQITSTPTTLSGYGISDTKANFNTALSDGTFMYVGDAPTAHTHTLSEVTDVTATVSEVNTVADISTITTPSIGWVYRVTGTGPTTVAWGQPVFSDLGSTPTTLSGYGISDTKANFNNALSDGTFLYVGDVVSSQWTTDTNGITYASNVGIGEASHLTYNLTVAGSVNIGSLYIDVVPANATISDKILFRTVGAGSQLVSQGGLNSSQFSISTGTISLNSTLSLVEITAPGGTPSAGTGYLYVDSADSKIKFKNDGAVVYDLTALGGAGDTFSTWTIQSDAGYTWGSANLTASGTDTVDFVAGSNITLSTDSTLKAIRITATGGGGAFTDLSDTPANYTASAGYLVRVNSTPNGLEFVDGTTLFQATSSNLTSLSGLTYTSAAFVKMTAANTFSLDTTTYSVSGHTHTLSTGATDVTATSAELNLLDLAGLTVGYVLRATAATTAAWQQLLFADLGSTPTTLSGYGISDTKANFDTALSDGTFAYAGGAFHDGFSDYVGNEHIDHTTVTITAGSGLSYSTGGTNIASSATIDLDINELTAETATVGSTDYVAMYDAGVGNRKVLLDNIRPNLTKGITIEDPTATEDATLFFTDVAITVTQLNAVVRGTTPSVTWTIRHDNGTATRSATGNEVVTGGKATTSEANDEITAFNDATIPAGSWVWLETTAQSGTVNELSVTITYKQD